MKKRRRKAAAVLCNLALALSLGEAAFAEEGPGSAVWDEMPGEGGNHAPDVQTEAPYVAPDNSWSEQEQYYDNSSYSGEYYTEEVWYEESYAEQSDEYTSSDTSADDTEGTIHRDGENDSSVSDAVILSKEDAENDFTLLDYLEIPAYMSLDVPEILQRPQLPTGCEATALTMALRYEGFDVGKTAIASEYLIYNYETDNMALGYVGDPFSEEGAGCFPPALAATAYIFLQDQEADYSVYNITGTTMEELLSYVADGTPVLVWTTMYMMEPELTREGSEYEGTVYQWYSQEHCVVLSGYDLSSGTLQINDPLEGIVTRDMEEFTTLYNRTGQMSVVLRQNDTAETESSTAAGTEASTDAGTETSTATVTEVGVQ